MRSTVCKIAMLALLPLAMLADWRQDMDGLCWSPPSAVVSGALGLDFHYLMNESNATTVVTDSSVNSRNGTSIRNTADMSVGVGKIGNGFKFNGSSDNVQYIGYNPNSQYRTFACWFKATASGEQYLIAAQDGGHLMELSVAGYPGKIAMVAYDVGFKKCFSTTAFTDYGWHHAAGTFNNSTQLQIYVDGKIENTVAVGQCSVGTNMIFGSHPAAARFSGTMDDVRVYSRLLSSNEIFSLWNNGNGTEADQ